MTRRTQAALLLQLALASGACRTTLDFVPASPAAVRSGMSSVGAGSTGVVQDARGEIHRVDATTPVRVRASERETPESTDLQGLARRCEAGRKCPLDDPKVSIEIGAYRSVVAPDAVANTVLGGGLVVGLVAGNIACFGADACSTEAKTAVAVVDVVLGVAAVVTVVALAVAWRNFRGD